MKSVFDHLKEAIDEHTAPAKERLLNGTCVGWDDYVRHSTEIRTADRLLEVIKDALKRLEEIENGSTIER